MRSAETLFANMELNIYIIIHYECTERQKEREINVKGTPQTHSHSLTEATETDSNTN